MISTICSIILILFQLWARYFELASGNGITLILHLIENLSIQEFQFSLHYNLKLTYNFWYFVFHFTIFNFHGRKIWYKYDFFKLEVHKAKSNFIHHFFYNILIFFLPDQHRQKRKPFSFSLQSFSQINPKWRQGKACTVLHLSLCRSLYVLCTYTTTYTLYRNGSDFRLRIRKSEQGPWYGMLCSRPERPELANSIQSLFGSSCWHLLLLRALRLRLRRCEWKIKICRYVINEFCNLIFFLYK